MIGFKKVDDKVDSNTTEDAIAWQDSADYDIGDTIPYKLTGTLPSNYDDFAWYTYNFTDTMEHLTYVNGSARVYAYGYDANIYANAGEKVYGWYDVTNKFDIAFANKKLTVNSTGATGIKGTLFDGNKGYLDGVQFLGEDVVNRTGTSLDKDAIDAMTVAEIDEYIGSDAAGQTGGVFLASDSKIVVRYEATLDADAAIGATGNPNDVYITYSNNPNKDHDGDKDTNDTPKDKVIVFTYKTTVDKVDENGAALKGAAFALYKEVPEGTEGAEKGADIKADWADAVKTAAVALADAKYYVVAGIKGTVDANTTQFSYTGIDDGTYVLVETTVPAGYNAWAAKEFTVTAEHDTEADEPALKKLTGTDPFTGEAWSGEVEITKKDTTKYKTESGELYTEIVNNSGTTLPETGGIGTTIFYIIGAILVIGAGVVLVTRRRMSAN